MTLPNEHGATNDVDLSTLMASLRVRPGPDGGLEAHPLDRGAGVIDAGTLLALITMAAAPTGADVRMVHADFVRAASPEQPVELRVSQVHRGRTAGLTTVTVLQNDRALALGQVAFGSRDGALLHHSLAPGSALGVSPAESRESARYGPYVRVTSAVDPFDRHEVHSPRWQLWADTSALIETEVPVEAYIAFHANQYLVSAAVLPHADFSMEDVHHDVLTVITSSTVAFHEPAGPERRWLLFDQMSTYGGGGWVYGRGEAYAEDEALLASFSQMALLRAGGTTDPRGGQRET